MQTLNDNSRSSGGGKAVARQSMTTSQATLYESGDEESVPLHSTQQFPRTLSEMQDLVPRPPIRKESASTHSLSLYDLDPQDSLPKIPARQSSDRLINASLRRRAHRRFRENSSSGSSTLGPPTSVLVPHESEWSGVSTLMTFEEVGISQSNHGEMIDSGLPPRLEEEPQLSELSMDKEFAEKLPWDKIAIGVAVVPENEVSIDHLACSSEVMRSDDTMSYPSFHHHSSESYLTANNIRPTGEGSSNVVDSGHSQSSVPRSQHHQHHPCQDMPRRSNSERRLASNPPAHAALVRPSRSASVRSIDLDDVQQVATLLYPSQHEIRNIPTPSMPPNLNGGTLSWECHVPHALPAAGHPAMTVSTTTARNNNSCGQDSVVVDKNGAARSWATSTAPTTTSSQPRPVERIMIDVAPGVKYPLRGSRETWNAIEEGRVTVTTCMSCNIELQCLADAQLVACPDCTMLSPVDQASDNSDNTGRYGVGVGVKPSDILRWIQLNNT